MKNWNWTLILICFGLIAFWVFMAYKAIPLVLTERTRHGYMSKEGDRRHWPRIGKKYFNDQDITTMAIDILKEEGQPLSEKEIINQIFKKIAYIKLASGGRGARVILTGGEAETQRGNANARQRIKRR